MTRMPFISNQWFRIYRNNILNWSNFLVLIVSNRKFERLGGPLDEIVTVFVHKYNVTMPHPNMTSWRHLIPETGCEDVGCFIVHILAEFKILAIVLFVSVAWLFNIQPQWRKSINHQTVAATQNNKWRAIDPMMTLSILSLYIIYAQISLHVPRKKHRSGWLIGVSTTCAIDLCKYSAIQVLTPPGSAATAKR